MLRNLVRGYQASLHSLSRLRQGVMTAVFVSVIITICYFGWSTYTKVPHWVWTQLYQKKIAELKIDINPGGIKTVPQTMKFKDSKGKETTRNVKDIVNDPFLLQTETQLISFFDQLTNTSLKISGYSFLVMISLWIWRGKRKVKAKLISGIDFMKASKLARKLVWGRKASDLSLGELPLVKDTENLHILISGATGQGKSNCINTLLPQIRKRGNKAVIVDVSGDYVSKFYRADKDIILNPFDERHAPWSPWADCQSIPEYDILAESIVPPKKYSHDNFWDDVGRVLLSVALQKLKSQGVTDTQRLYSLLKTDDLRDFSKFFENTEAALYTAADNEKTTLSIRANLATLLSSFKLLETTQNPFSIRNWLREENDSWLFLMMRPDQRDILFPLVSAWFNTSINEVMEQETDSKRLVWFVIDGLAALNPLPSLEQGLSQGRKYGACFMVGLHNVHQIIERYGREAGLSMLDLFNTKIFFKSTEPNTVEWISRSLGEIGGKLTNTHVHYDEVANKNIVYLSEQTTSRFIVKPSDIANLESLNAFVKLPDAWPVTKIKMKYQNIEKIAEPFLAKSKKPGVFDFPEKRRIV